MYHFKFADIGEGIHEGKLLEWMVSEGDAVKSGDSLFLVETDKVNAEIPSPVKGTVSKLMAQVGDIIKVGDVIVDIEEEGSVQEAEPQKKENEEEPDKPLEIGIKPEASEEAKPETLDTAEKESPEKPQEEAVEKEVKPESLDTAEKKSSEKPQEESVEKEVKPEALDTAEKKSSEKPQEEAVEKEVKPEALDTAEKKSSEKPQEEAVEKEKTEEKSAGVVGEISVSNDLIPSFSEGKPDKASSKKKVLATPVARKMAKDMGVDITLVKGSGTMGRVMKEDIKTFRSSDAAEKTEVPSAPVHTAPQTGSIEEVELSTIRKSMSKSMTLSKQLIPHTVLMDEFDVSSLVEFRKESKEEALLQGIKLTYMPFIIKAVTIALKEFPIFNCVYDHENEKLLLKKFYNIGVATDTPDGLIVPVIKDTAHMGILEMAKEMNRLIEASRNKKLTLDDIQGGTFSITNYGALGSLFGTPIIKHPQVAILGIGKINKKPVVSEEGYIEVKDIMPISMAVDHRIIDGADAGRFVERLKQLLSNPKLLLMS
ncbi:2-oxo acid dehydrogenase subunit E2 [uncultured Ilyobacter sp.]|uniref:dihydrolipoamide acetyltransferase family protein n=1 Tax=uncultured Ilyobacter sp. TaxID=544433 RepID=UPI0029F5689F|nr:2-oxo acid dehydrogenase subunit E2 [uncultured Ilyobacter sp.]